MTRHSSIFFTLGFLILSASSQSSASDNGDKAAQALRDGEVAAFVKDWEGKDADRIAAHYTADGNVMIPNAPMMTGPAAIGKTLKDALADPNWSLSLQPLQVEVSRSGDLGYTRGTYVLTGTDPVSKKAVTEKGRFLTIFRKEAGGSWKAVQDINNAEAPAASK
jgi:ketosteroid isomerase-like protein